MCLADRFNVLALIFATVLCHQNPSILFISAPQVVNLGSFAELKCSTQYLSDYPLLWLKLPDQVIAVGASKIVPDNHITMGFFPGSNLYRLQFNDVQEIDGGTYQCQILLSSGHRITADTKIIIQRPPVITFDTSQNIITGAGQDITLFCNATGQPVPEITWRRSGNNILPTGGFKYYGHELKLFNIQRKDRGIYICTAFNGVGKGDSTSILVSVEFAPEIHPVQSSITTSLNKDVELMCSIESFPEPSVSWYFNNEDLHNNYHHIISKVVYSSGIILTRLRILDIQKDDLSTYTCQAMNKLGTSIAEIILKQ